MTYKLIDLVDKLVLEGHDIKFIKRNDGGLIIKSIDGVSYAGKSGNAVARALAGYPLSASQLRQRQQNAFKQRKNSLSDNLRKAIQKTQRLWRKNAVKTKGKITTKKIRFKLKIGESEEEVLKALDQAQAYAKGIAYDKNVEILIMRMERAIEFGLDIREALKRVEELRYRFKEEWITPIYEILYDLENGLLEAEEANRRIIGITNGKKLSDYK